MILFTLKVKILLIGQFTQKKTLSELFITWKSLVQNKLMKSEAFNIKLIKDTLYSTGDLSRSGYEKMNGISDRVNYYTYHKTQYHISLFNLWSARATCRNNFLLPSLLINLSQSHDYIAIGP